MKRSHQLSIGRRDRARARRLWPEGRAEGGRLPAPAAPAGATVTIAHAGPLPSSIAHLGKDDENGVATGRSPRRTTKKIVIGGKPVNLP